MFNMFRRRKKTSASVDVECDQAEDILGCPVVAGDVVLCSEGVTVVSRVSWSRDSSGPDGPRVIVPCGDRGSILGGLPIVLHGGDVLCLSAGFRDVSDDFTVLRCGDVIAWQDHRGGDPDCGDQFGAGVVSQVWPGNGSILVNGWDLQDGNTVTFDVGPLCDQDIQDSEVHRTVVFLGGSTQETSAG